MRYYGKTFQPPDWEWHPDQNSGLVKYSRSGDLRDCETIVRTPLAGMAAIRLLPGLDDHLR